MLALSRATVAAYGTVRGAFTSTNQRRGERRLPSNGHVKPGGGDSGVDSWGAEVEMGISDSLQQNHLCYICVVCGLG